MLDLLRAVALGRVVVWHVVGAAWLTAFTAIPVMFFVAGTLLVGDGRRSYGATLRRRLKRLLVPLWLYGAVVAAVGAAQAHADGVGVRLEGLGLLRALSWILPVVDPLPSDWHNGWLSTHLWYLRAYFWILLLAPVLAVLARRVLAGAAVVVVLVAQVEATRFVDVPGVSGSSLRVLLGDLTVYGLFTMLGMAHRRARRAPDRRLLALGAVVCGSAAVVYARATGLPDGTLNSSYPALALAGLAWLCAAGAAEPQLRAVAERVGVRSATEAISRRALTVYLWHPAAIVVAFALVESWTAPGTATPTTAVLGLTVLLTGVAVVLVGFVEDVAAGRRAFTLRLPAVRGPIVSPTLVVALMVATPAVAEPEVPVDRAVVAFVPGVAGVSFDGAAASAAATRLPPSFREALANGAFATDHDRTTAPIRLRDDRVPARLLQRALQRWHRAHPDVTAVAVAIRADGRAWSGASQRPGATAIDPHAPYRTASLTKLFTAALVLRTADGGMLDLDAPAPRLAGLRIPRRSSWFTPRQLLQHTSGLVDFRAVPGFDAAAPLDARAALRGAIRFRRHAPPGTEVHYSNSGYLYLGQLLEQIHGRPYEQLVAEVAALAGVRVSVVPASDASGGVHASQADLARFLETLLTPGRIVSAARVAQLTTLGAHNLGMGTWPLCPCWTDARGARRSSGIGHHVGNGGLYHDSGGATVSIHLEPFSERTGVYVESLQQLLVAVLRR